MNKKREEFLARLRETFRAEAGEHLEAIASGLVAMEQAGDVGRTPIVERIFREVHSLKGAARSVSLGGVETLCQEIESVFAALKGNDIPVSAALLDALHPAIDVIGILCANPGVEPSPEDREKERLTLAALTQINRERPPAIAVSDAPSAAVEPSGCAAIPAAAPPPEEQAAALANPAETIRVSTAKLASILREAEELMSSRIAGYGYARELRALADDLGLRNRHCDREVMRLRSGQDGSSGAARMIESEVLYSRTIEKSLRALAKSLHQEAHTLGSIVDALLEDAKKVLMLPCSSLLHVFPRLARDLAREQGKDVELSIRGEDIEIDRRILDEMKDPLLHLLRNCIDHGIEKPGERRELGKPQRGMVIITVTPVMGNRVEFTIGDDGAGIDAERVRKYAVLLGIAGADEAVHLSNEEITKYIFCSGLTTSPIITDLSGRGLGLAIVREKVEKLGGTITVESTPGAGATFRMSVPLSMATFRGVFVEAAGQRFILPASNVVCVARVKPGEIKTMENRQTIAMNGRAVSLVRLRDVLGISGPEGLSTVSARPVVVVRATDRQIAFMVDEVRGEQEVMVKSLGPQLARVRNVESVSISGNGAVIPVLNIPDLVESAITTVSPAVDGNPRDAAPERRARLLIAEDSITARTLVKAILEGAGYEVVAAVDGMDALTALKTEPFDLVVSDVDMPRMNGFELTSRIRADKKLEDLPVVLVTALGSRKDREYGIEAGANAYIVKSDFDQSNLLEIIARLL